MSNFEKKKIVILGGGVGGLASAHELSKYIESHNLDITLIERNNLLGGQARSSINKEGLHTEYCWHAESSNGYVYFLDIIDEIINPENGFKVISHLKPLNKFIYARNINIANSPLNYIEYGKAFITDYNLFASGFKNLYGHSIPLCDRIKLNWIYIKASLLCKERIQSYDNKLWKDEINGLSKEIKKWILDSTSIFLGMDYNKISKHFMYDLIRKNKKSYHLESKINSFYSFDGPMNDVLFNVWQSFLENKGVKFMLETEIIKINTKHRKIESVNVKHSDYKYKVFGDIFINSMDVKNLYLLYPSLDKKLLAKKNQYYKLFKNSYQIQTQILFYLPKRLQKDNDNGTILLFPDSPWFLMTRIEGDLWKTKKDFLSCGIGIWDKKGILFNKSAINCSKEEIAKECWHQMIECQHNMKLPKKMPKWDMWESFEFNNETKTLETYEPKFSNNINTLHLRPNYKDDLIHNLYHSNAYTRTHENIFNMESGMEAGYKVSQLIIGKKDKHIYNKPHWIIRFIRKCDYVLFRLFHWR